MEFHDVYWLAVLFLVFLPFEIYTVITKKRGDTFSEWVWDAFAIRNKNAKYGTLRRFILFGFLVSLVAHLVYTISVVWTIIFAVGMIWSIAYHYVKEVEK